MPPERFRAGQNPLVPGAGVLTEGWLTAGAPSLAPQECAQQLSLKGNMRKTSCFREIFNMFFIFGRQLVSENVLLLPGQHD